MRPKWSNAPSWAEWIAMDSDGLWQWFEKEPTMLSSIWGCNGGKAQLAGHGDEKTKPYWRATKESRRDAALTEN